MMMRLFSLLASCFFFSGSSGNFCLLSIYCVAVLREKVWNTIYENIQTNSTRQGAYHDPRYLVPSTITSHRITDERCTTVLRQSCEFQVLMFRIKFAGTGTLSYGSPMQRSHPFVYRTRYYCRIDLTTIFNDKDKLQSNYQRNYRYW